MHDIEDIGQVDVRHPNHFFDQSILHQKGNHPTQVKKTNQKGTTASSQYK